MLGSIGNRQCYYCTRKAQVNCCMQMSPTELCGRSLCHEHADFLDNGKGFHCKLCKHQTDNLKETNHVA
jgi:hypothetical protein